MAACQLTIELDDSKPRTGGEPITGKVTVVATKNVNCKGLKVSTLWSTLGMGNTDLGICDQQQVFAGAWQAGNSYSYPFKLNTGSWPPTYYGNYLSVSHFVEAQAGLSWATDPKTRKEFLVVATDSPADLKPVVRTVKAGLIGGILLSLLAIVFAFAFLPLLLFLLAIGLPIAAVIYFVKVILPKQITGPIELTIKTPKVAPGGLVEANLTFTPKRNSTIHGIDWTIQCVEECSSGSGSSRKTHRNELLKEAQRSIGDLQLKANERQSFDFRFQLRAKSAPSLKFTDNELKWSITSRIDIPRWPDWSKTVPLIVTPDASVTLAAERDYDDDDEDDEDYDDDDDVDESEASVAAAAALPASGAESEKIAADQAWFKQVIDQIRSTQHDETQLAVVLGAVGDFEFPISITIEDEIDTPEFSDEAEFDQWDEAEWWMAFCPAQNADLAIAWELATPKTVKKGSVWSGTASIIGYELSTQRILMKAL